MSPTHNALELAPNLTIPPTAVAECFGVVGARGSGKTYLASKLVELMLDEGHQVVVVDPVGVWGRGLRLAADGKARACSTRSSAVTR